MVKISEKESMLITKLIKLHEENITLREANRQLRELIDYINTRLSETEQRFKEAQNAQM